MTERATARRRLIVSADDFGLSAGVNEAVRLAFDDGLLTSTSLMVTGMACEEAVELARARPALGVGLHLVLVQGRACSPDPILTDGRGEFSRRPVGAGFRYQFSRRARLALEREVVGQLERFAATGLPLSHVDGHLNIHLHPVVLDILLRHRETFGLRAVRVPREPLALSLAADGRWRARKRLESFVFHRLARHAVPRLREAGLPFTDQVFGLHSSGHLTEAVWLRLLECLPPGVTEIYGHPTLPDEEARRWRPADYEGEAELAALRSERVRAATVGIDLIRYADLV